MKKAFLASVLAISALTLSAQTALVKEAGNDMKGKKPDYAAIVSKLQPALTNPETSGDVNTWMLVGKASIGLYDNLFKQQALGQDVDVSRLGNSLMDGLEYFITALPLDSLPNEKGKISPKNSKEIIKQVKDNYLLLDNLARNMYNVQDYNGAYRAWDMYLEIPRNPVLGKNAPIMQHDTVMCEIAFNKGIAAWQADSLNKALASFRQAINLGYNKKQVYDYAISIAATLNDKDAMTELATAAYPLYGDEDVKYLQLMINPKIEAKEYDTAHEMLEEALAAQPQNGQIYFSLGTIEDIRENREKAIEYYLKAIELKPDLAIAKLYLGQALYNQAAIKDDEASKLSMKEYNEVRATDIEPLFQQAIPYLEEAYQLDSENMRPALNLLRTIYYYLGDADNLERIEQLSNE